MSEKPPLFPRSLTNPVGQTRRIRKARGAINRQLRQVERMILGEWAKVRVVVVNRTYDYQMDLEVLAALVRRIARELSDLGHGTVEEIVRQAYREGAAKAARNIGRLVDDYTRTATQAVASRAVQRRAALAAARTFEEMEGFSGETGARLSRILFGAVQDGVNPRVAARDIRREFRVSRHRAERIARTEITMAHRRGRMDEATETGERFNIELGLIHNSALIPGRTRRTHAARHGKIVTIQDQREFYSRDANGINCLCSATEVRLNPDGTPRTGAKAIRKMIERRKAFTG